MTKSKALQREILEERAVAVGQTDREFYKKNRSSNPVNHHLECDGHSAGGRRG